uniref:Uncharacterized protein n=1 Tax=Ciona intestinalis TaxID=7719 RepID=H2XYW3_CIOIN
VLSSPTLLYIVFTSYYIYFKYCTSIVCICIFSTKPCCFVLIILPSSSYVCVWGG